MFEVECCDGDVRLCCNCCVVTVHPFAIEGVLMESVLELGCVVGGCVDGGYIC